jgi:chromosome segregation ATPase
MEKFKEKITQLKLEIDTANARADQAEQKLSELTAALSSKGTFIQLIFSRNNVMSVEAKIAGYQSKIAMLQDEIARTEDRISEAKQQQAENDALQGQTDSYVVPTS